MLLEVVEKSLNFTQACLYEPWSDCHKLVTTINVENKPFSLFLQPFSDAIGTFKLKYQTFTFRKKCVMQLSVFGPDAAKISLQ